MVSLRRDAWLSDRDARAPTPAELPSELRPGERWIDVDIASQVLTAYVGERPVFATLVSTGRGSDGSVLATPRGTHRLWVKLRGSNMDNLDDESAAENYAIQAVPWVMYFDHGYGLHGTFWHREFGSKHSHGCVNLTPARRGTLVRLDQPEAAARMDRRLTDQLRAGNADPRALTDTPRESRAVRL